VKLPFCVACGNKEDLHHHHLIPKVKGGTNEDANLLTLCHSCHKKLHHAVDRDWGNHSDLTKAGMSKKKKDGLQWSASAYGFDFVNGKAIENEAEMSIIKLMIERRKKGLSYQAICDHLNDEGILTKKGHRWGRTTIRRLVVRFS